MNNGLLKRIAWKPGYEGDEIALAIGLAFALHAIPITILVLNFLYPNLSQEEEKPLVAQPVIGATLLKLGKPIDPTKLPDRIVPKARTAPQQKIVASREDPTKKTDKPDAGPPPPNTQESDLQRLIAKSDPFAEDGGKERPEEGRAEGVEGGTETDPNKVRAGDMYGAQLNKFFHDNWQIPTVISEGEARKMCVKMMVAIDPRMRIWFVEQNPLHGSGNDLFDDSARNMLQKLRDVHTALPEPPKEVDEQYRGRRIALNLGDGCK
jgi:hypothetical protein